MCQKLIGKCDCDCQFYKNCKEGNIFDEYCSVLITMSNTCTYWPRPTKRSTIENWEPANSNHRCLKFTASLLIQNTHFRVQSPWTFHSVATKNSALIFPLHCSRRSSDNSDKVRNGSSIMLNVLYLYTTPRKIILPLSTDLASIYCALHFIEIKKCKWYA